MHNYTLHCKKRKTTFAANNELTHATIIMHYISYGFNGFHAHRNYSTHALKEHAILNPVKYLIISYASSGKGHLSYTPVSFSDLAELYFHYP